ncbi:hypothetical protein [Nocardiopsis sp. LOL_012]|uniref:hypothetical protein n=1 Tax=Nocardiopsis sp. LOL_012 TaxID=3345409 RepID=UPI003A83FDC2
MEKLESLHLEKDEPKSLPELLERLENKNGRRIQLHPWNAYRSKLCGAWVASENTDHIFYADLTSRAHQRHIILHELAHMIWGHTLLSNDQALTELFPSLPPSAVRRMLLRKRARYDSVEEQQAEMTATILGQQIDSLPPPPTPHGPLRRLQRTLSGKEEEPRI